MRSTAVPAVPTVARLRGLVHEIAKFGIVGGVGFVVDLGVFNLLWYGVGGVAPLHDKPLTARAISVLLATAVTYLGNRHWTWRARPWRRFRHEYTLFFLLNAAGFAVNLAILAFVNYGLGLRDDAVANNAGNLAGIAIGTAFRFWAYRRFVFRDAAAPGPGARSHDHERSQVS